VSTNPRDVFAAQLDAIVAEYEDARRRSQHDDASDAISNTKAVEMVTRAHAAIERVGGRNSVYGRQAEVIVSQKIHEWAKLWHLVGVAQSLSHDLKAGYLTSLEELIHGEVFGDFLEMAEYLLENGYKDAAAVIAGSTLEAHLKQLCKRAGLASDVNTSSGTRPKKADQLNAELSKAAVYGILDQKNVTAWLDLRNKAAHGVYSGYQKEQVAIMVSGIRDFMTRCPA
jgi:hypothetical protein